jgi:hypothetical protein
MKHLALAVAAILVAGTGAFAGSDHYGTPAAPPAATIDTTRTASIRKPDMSREGAQAMPKPGAEESGQGIWGN